MKDLLIYQLQVASCLTIFFLFYKLFLSKETNFKIRRLYLFTTGIVSFLIPALTINFVLKSSEIPIDYFAIIPDRIITYSTSDDHGNELNLLNTFAWIWIIGLAFMILRLLISLYNVNNILKLATPELQDKNLRITHAKVQSFSFFKTIVLSEQHYRSKAMKYILAHEQVHTDQFHSIDVFCMELIKTLQWFNPLAWLFADEAIQNLEYLADQKVIHSLNNAEDYQLAIVQFAQNSGSKLLHLEFSKSNLKNRIIMMNQSKRKNINVWKLFLIVPIVGVLFMSFSVKIENLDIKKEVVEMLPSINDPSNLLSKEKDYSTLLIQKDFTNAGDQSTQLQSIDDNASNQESGISNFSTKSDTVIINTKTNTNQAEAGSTSFIAEDGKKPLVILDGEEITNEELALINPESIQSISVIKEQDAVNKYGEKAKNGVILIQLKEGVNSQNNGKMILAIPEYTDLTIKGQVGETVKVKTNGNLNFDQSNPPLVYKDGVEISMDELEKIDPNSIESINIIKDETANEKYGEKGKNGVIFITSKEK